MREQTKAISRWGQESRHVGRACLVAALAGCGPNEHGAGAPPAAGTRISSQLTSSDPCGWLPAADVSSALGHALSGVPVRVASAESLTPSVTGRACLYLLAPSGGGTGDMVTLEVKPDGAEMQAGLGAAAIGDFAARADAAAPWDWVGGLPAGLFAARRGHLGVLISISSATIAPRDVEPLARRLAAAVPDLPFEQAVGDAAVAGAAPDPCALLTRAEVEGVLGPLAQPAFRSHDSTPIAWGNGPSCTWLASGHRALVLTPTRSEGRTLFTMTRGIAGLTALATGASPATRDTGPWDDRATGPVGALYYLKGDQMLAFQHRASGLSESQVNTLAALAFPRLATTEIK